VPVLGKGYRDESGVAILNMLIYQDPENLDQIIAYDAELYINFHAAGVVVGYALLGCLIAFFQARFVRSRQPIDSYIWLTVSLWVVFPGSLPVLSQICVYFFWPAYLYLALTWMTSAGRHSEDDAQSVGRSPLGDSFPDESRPGFIAS
jgi:hypothetical protein